MAVRIHVPEATEEDTNTDPPVQAAAPTAATTTNAEGADYKKPPDAMAPFVCYASAGMVTGSPTEETQQALAAEMTTTQEAIMQGKCVLDSGATRSLGSAQAIEQVMRLSADAVANIDVKAQGQDGTLKVHALSGGEGRIIQLEQTTSGHQVFPLTQDFYTNSTKSSQEVPSLKAYVQNAPEKGKETESQLSGTGVYTAESSCEGSDVSDSGESEQLSTSHVDAALISSTPAVERELRLALRQVGEDPPARWTKPELRLRLEQVTGEDMSKKVKKETVERSPYEDLVKRMNAASRRKQELIDFCHKELRMSNLERMTIAMIQHAAMYKIYEMAPAHPSDIVGFGTHGRLTYRALRQQEPGYAKWVKETARKDEGKNHSDPRLIRLARWLENEGDEEMVPETKKIDYKNLAITKAKSKARGSRDGHATTEATSSNPEDMALDLMKNMCQAIEDLKNEVAVLKQEPRRKTHSKEEDQYDPTSTG
ncbi:GIP, partial [Symbiodinium necroappetens]